MGAAPNLLRSTIAISSKNGFVRENNATPVCLCPVAVSFCPLVALHALDFGKLGFFLLEHSS